MTNTNSSDQPGIQRTPGKGINPEPQAIQPNVPQEFGLVQVWWGNGKGKTTAAMGMGFRAAGHGYRVHILQFMKGGASSVEAVRGEYNAINAFPGFTYENSGHYGWHGMADGTADTDHQQNAEAGFERATEIVESSRTIDEPISFDAPPERGVHMLILDEILYAVNRNLIEVSDLLELVDGKPASLELVLTGGHQEPDYIREAADLITHVEKQKHPMERGQRARKGTEY